jgi:DNA-directed RNA polymerase subunit N (RpoN/RPB10)
MPEPIVDAFIRQTVCVAIALAWDVLQTDLLEPRHLGDDLGVERSQMGRLDLVPARKLLDQELAVRAEMHSTGPELRGPTQAFSCGRVLSDVVGGLTEPLGDLG